MNSVRATLRVGVFLCVAITGSFGSVEEVAEGIFQDLLLDFPRVEGNVLQARGQEVRISVGRSQGVVHGMVLRVFRDHGRWRRFNKAKELEGDWSPCGWIRVTRLFDETSMAEVLEGRVLRGNRVSTETIVYPVELTSFVFQGERNTVLGGAIRDLLMETMERSGRFVPWDGEEAFHVPAFRLQGELVDTTGSLGITVKWSRMPEDRLVRLLTRKMPMTTSLRRLLGSPLAGSTPYAAVARLSLNRQGVCDVAMVPLANRQWVALLSGDGIDMIRFEADRLEVLPGLQFSSFSDSAHSMGHLLARQEGQGNEMQVIFGKVGEEEKSTNWRVSGIGFEFLSVGGFPFLWKCPVEQVGPVCGRLVPGRNYFQRNVGDWVVPVEFVDLAKGRLFDASQVHYCVVGRDGFLYVFDDVGFLLWRGDQPCGSRIAISDWDGNGIDEIACTSPFPLGTQDYVRVLEWNGETFWEKWRSETQQGSILGLVGADMDGDGRDELIVVTEGAAESEGMCGIQVFRATGSLGAVWD